MYEKVVFDVKMKYVIVVVDKVEFIVASFV